MRGVVGCEIADGIGLGAGVVAATSREDAARPRRHGDVESLLVTGARSPIPRSLPLGSGNGLLSPTVNEIMKGAAGPGRVRDLELGVGFDFGTGGGEGKEGREESEGQGGHERVGTRLAGRKGLIV